MPTMRIKEIREMSSEDRTKRVGDMQTELARLKTMIGAGGQVENPARIRELRKGLARILTIEHEQKLGLNVPKTKPKKKAKTESKKREKKEE